MIRMPEPNPPAIEQRPTKRQLLFYLIVLACSALYLWTGYQICVDKAQLFRNEMGLTETVARVETIVNDRNDMGQIGGTVYYERVITFWARILSGERKGEQVKVVQTIDNLTGNGQLPVRPARRRRKAGKPASSTARTPSCCWQGFSCWDCCCSAGARV